jgi:aspartyl-tRNA(Asn)/glutamyl-tRNA(Gln) amidotransferase subunit A
MIDTLRLTAEQVNDLLEKGEASSQEIFDAYRAAIDERDGELHCFLRLCDGEGEGIPIALKDVIGTKGVETTAGSKILAGYVPVYDSTVATRCKGRGLRLIGKTNTDEFAMGSSTENSAWPVTEPVGPTASGGRLGARRPPSRPVAPWALGSDTGGSIKQPAALCGNVGLRPTYGTVSRYGIIAFASSLDQVGPVTKTVRDGAFLYSVISGRDPADSTTVDVPPVEIPEGEDLKGLRVGAAEMCERGIEPGVAVPVTLCGARAEVGSARAPVEGLRATAWRPAGACPTSPATTASRYSSRRRRNLHGHGTRDEGFGDEPAPDLGNTLGRLLRRLLASTAVRRSSASTPPSSSAST